MIIDFSIWAQVIRDIGSHANEAGGVVAAGAAPAAGGGILGTVTSYLGDLLKQGVKNKIQEQNQGDQKKEEQNNVDKRMKDLL